MKRYFRFLSRATLAGFAAALLTFTAPAPANALTLTVDGGAVQTQTTGSVVYAKELIGVNSTGTYNHLGGSNSITETLGSATLILGSNTTGNGTYNLNGGNLSADNEYIGQNGTGIFNHTGGTNTITGPLSIFYGNLFLGSGATGNGTYNLSSSGNVQTGFTYVGHSSTGTFNQTGGGLNSKEYIGIGETATGSGSYNLSGSGTISTTAINVGNNGTGSFVQSGGTITFTSGSTGFGTGKLSVGAQAGSTGTYELSGTGSIKAGSEVIGNLGTGTFTQTGGTNRVSSSPGLLFNGTLILGADAGGNGTYYLKGGSLIAKNENIGQSGMGILRQTSGTNTVNRLLTLGYWGGSGGGYELSGTGTLNANNVLVGSMGTGNFFQTGGSANITNSLNIASGTGSSGTYNLAGGVLTVGNSTHTSTVTNNGTLNYSGGALDVDSLTNNKNLNLSGAGMRVINGNVINSATGTIKATGTTALFTGTVTNNGAYISDPSTNYFTNLTVGTTGYLVGGVGDIFSLDGSLTSSSTQNTLWSTANAYLSFNGFGGHNLSLTGIDMGASTTGYTNNFAWDTLEVASGNSLTLLDGNTAAGAGLYLNEILGLTLSGGTITNVNGSTGLNVYYNALFGGNSYLGGLDYALTGGGYLIALNSAGSGTGGSNAVPEPSTLLLLGSGLAGLGFVRRKFAV